MTRAIVGSRQAWITADYDEQAASQPSVGASPDLFFSPVSVKAASGDTTGTTDRINIQLAASAALSANVPVYISGNYIIDTAIIFSSNLHVQLAPGTVIKLKDKVVVSATWTSSSANVSVTSVAGIVAGMQVSDAAADISANNPFGAIPWGTTVLSVSATLKIITLSAIPTSSGTSLNLNFHPRDNVIIATNCHDFSLTCRGGWATLDANGSNSYQYNVSADDSKRNAIRLVNPNTYLIEGISAENAYYHGCIIVGQAFYATIPRFRAKNNGFRGIHMHGEAVSGNTTPQLRDNWLGRIIVEGNGHKAIKVRSGNENNSGCFIVFDNTINTQIDSLLAKNEYGFGCHVNGGNGLFTGAFVSKYLQIANYVAEGCATGLRIESAVEGVQIANYQVHGNNQTLSSCITYADSSTTQYYVLDDGTTGTIKTKIIDIPANSINNTARPDLSLRAGMRIFMGGGSGAPSSGLIIWDVSSGTGAAGRDQLVVFNEDSTSNDPYTSAVTTNAYVWQCKDSGINLYSPSGPGIRSIKFGSIVMDNPGRYGITTQYSSSTFRGTNIEFGDVAITGATLLGLDLSSLNHWSMRSYHSRNNGSGFITTATVSGSYNNRMQNCCNFTVGNLRAEHDAVFTNNNETLRVDADCRNGTVNVVASRKPASGYTVNVLTTNGAAANTAGVAGPIILNNPTASDGTQLTVSGGHINRTDVSACIVTRPTDA